MELKGKAHVLSAMLGLTLFPQVPHPTLCAAHVFTLRTLLLAPLHALPAVREGIPTVWDPLLRQHVNFAL